MSVKPEPPTKPPGRTVRPFVFYTAELACKWSSESMNLGWRLGERQSLRSVTCPRCSLGHQDHLEVQGILTVRCYTSLITSLITSQRRHCGRRLQMETFEISPFCPAILARSHPFGFKSLLSISIVSFIRVSCFLDSPRATKRYFFATSRIAIFPLGPQTQQRRGVHTGLSKEYIEKHGNVRWRVPASERIASGLHFATLLTLNHHNYQYRRIVIYYIRSLLRPRAGKIRTTLILLVRNVCFRTMVIRRLARG